MNQQALLETQARRRYNAMTAADLDTLDRLLDEQLVYTHSRGNRDSKSSYLDKPRTGVLSYGPIRYLDDPPTFLGPEVAIVTGEMTSDVQVHGVSRRMRNAYLAVWTHHNGSWRLTAYQPTPLE